jgi:hypothetical protein
MNEVVVHAAASRSMRRPVVHHQNYYGWFIVDVYTFTNYSGEQLAVRCFDGSQEAYDEINYTWGSKV